MKTCRLLLLVLIMAFAMNSVALAASPLEEAVDELLGTSYKYGGTSTDGFDCSGFTQYVMEKFDFELPRTSSDQSKEGNPVEKKDLRTGDLVFFNTSGNGISHVGIYMGDGKFAHSSTNEGVIISDLSEPYYAQRYVKARRIMGKFWYDRIAVEQTEQTETEQ